MKLTVHCCLCSEEFQVEVTAPDGWEHLYGEVDNERDGFCPRHAKVAAFAQSQCPGCVGGWGDCPMWKAFAYSCGRDIMPADFASLERGVCPRRVNGTLSIGPKGIEDIDLSDTAPREAGSAFAQAIRDYCELYPAERRARA